MFIENMNLYLQNIYLTRGSHELDHKKTKTKTTTYLKWIWTEKYLKLVIGKVEGRLG